MACSFSQEEEWYWCAHDQASWSPLLAACSAGDVSEISRLLKESPECINDKSSNGKSALHIAAYYASADVLDVLVKAKPDLLDARDSEGFTPLFESVKSKNIDNTFYLVKHGADVTAVNNKEQNIFQIAAIAKNIDVFKFLIK